MKGPRQAPRQTHRQPSGEPEDQPVIYSARLTKNILIWSRDIVAAKFDQEFQNLYYNMI